MDRRSACDCERSCHATLVRTASGAVDRIDGRDVVAVDHDLGVILAGNVACVRVVLVPLVILVPATLIFARIAMLPLAIGIWIALGPVMGGRVSWHTIGSAVPTSRRANTVRVLTYNTQGGRVVALNIRSLLERVQPDLIAFQECGDQLWDTLQAMPTWHGSRHASLCTASRWEIASAEAMPNADFARIAQFGFGGTGLVARYVLNTPQGPLIFVNLHLETARKGLEALTSQDGLLPDRASSLRGPQLKQLADAENRIDLNAQIRDRESERAAVWVAKGDKRVPLLVAGDFNIPVESTIFREHWSDFTDAFESTGTGFGWSKREGTWLHIRIDHVLGNSTAPAPVGAWLERDLGSDHLPVVADLRWGAR